MIVKKRVIKKGRNFYFDKLLKIYFFSTVTIASLIILFFLNTGYWNQIKDPFLERLHKSSVIHYLKIFEIGTNSIKGFFYKIPELNINISFENLIKIENDRKKVLETAGGSGGAYDFLEVPVKLDQDNKSYRADLRLKGDRKIHFENKKHSSYKIDIRKDNTIFGIKKFSVMKPRARNYIHEWLFHELNGEGGLVKLKYDFIKLKINGESQGLYVVEEGFGKILLERNKRRNGPIFSLHEEFTAEFKKNSKFEVYNKRYWLSDSNIKLTEIASQKLRELFDNKKNIDLENLLDLDKWAWYFAVADINNYFHALIPKSVKFYYNPISGKFEPIGFDAHRVVPNYSKYYNWEEQISRHGPSSLEIAKSCKEKPPLKKCKYFIYNFFYNSNGDLNKIFYNKYRKAILKISSKKFLDNFFSKRKIQIDIINSKIYSDYFFVDHLFFYGPGLYYFDKNDFYVKANLLLNSVKSEPEKVFIQQNDQNIIVENDSVNNNNLIIKELYCINKLFNNQTKVDLNYKINTKINKTNKIELKKHYDEELVCKKALIVNAHSNRKIVKTIDTLNNFREVNYKQVYVDNYKNYFVSYNNILKLKKDFTLIDENIFIPKNFLVKINSGQSITLINNAFIFSDSAWVVDGSKQKIYISGEKKNFGGGLIISDSNKKSIFKNVTFSYLSGLKSNSYDKKNEIFITTKTAYQSNNRNSYKEEAFVLDKKSVNLNSQYILFGSINFFNTKVILKEIIFEKISSEDALNIVSSDFEIDKIKFLENLHDGLDIDFGNGSINRSKFINIGNDAIDLSGSKVTINDTDINLVGDKMISVGENSNIEILNLDGSNSFVGIAVKDGSTIKADRIRLNNTKIGFAAYQKKEEYLYPKIIANNINIQNANVKWLTDNNSKIVLNNKLINSKTDKILPIIYEQNIELLN